MSFYGHCIKLSIGFKIFSCVKDIIIIAELRHISTQYWSLGPPTDTKMFHALEWLEWRLLYDRPTCSVYWWNMRSMYTSDSSKIQRIRPSVTVLPHHLTYQNNADSFINLLIHKDRMLKVNLVTCSTVAESNSPLKQLCYFVSSGPSSTMIDALME